jgi:hypothetical protein
MKTILVPTDFTNSSLDIIEQIATTFDDKLVIMLFHALDMPSSLVEAMINNSAAGHHSFVTEELRQRCRRLKIAHPNISNISFKFMYGTTSRVFENFATAHNIDLIVIPEGYYFTYVVRESVNPMPMFSKSRIPVTTTLTGAGITSGRKVMNG